jgi:hypothetical protein
MLWVRPREGFVTVERTTDRTFGLLFAGVFGLVALVAWLSTGQIYAGLVVTSGAFLVVALVLPGLLLPLNRAWASLAQRIATVSNHLLLGGFFFLVVLPFGAAARLFGKKLLLKRPDPAVDGYWTPVGRQATPETYPDLF